MEEESGEQGGQEEQCWQLRIFSKPEAEDRSKQTNWAKTTCQVPDTDHHLQPCPSELTHRDITAVLAFGLIRRDPLTVQFNSF